MNIKIKNISHIALLKFCLKIDNFFSCPLLPRSKSKVGKLASFFITCKAHFEPQDVA